MTNTIKRYWPVFVLPTMLAFAIGFLIPFVSGLYLSFCDFTTVSNATFVGFSNYVKAFTDTSSDFLHALWFTAAFAGISTVLINLFGLAIALLLVRGFKGTNIFRTVFFLPNMIGGIVLGVIENLSKAYISTQLSDAIVFAVLIVVLLVKPTGILGKKISEKV